MIRLKSSIILGLVVCSALFLFACLAPSSREQGAELAVSLLGDSGAVLERLADDGIAKRITDAAMDSPNAEEFIVGFCERGEQIVWEKIDRIRQEGGATVATREEIEDVFAGLRAELKASLPRER